MCGKRDCIDDDDNNIDEDVADDAGDDCGKS